MKPRFVSIDEFLDSFEVELANMLYDYDLHTSKFNVIVKKVILYVFIQKLNDLLQDKSVIIYCNGEITNNHELVIYYPHDKLSKFIVQICFTIKKHINRLIFVSPNTVINNNVDLDGEVLDELVLLDNAKFPDLKKLKSYLEKHNLKEMFSSLIRKI